MRASSHRATKVFAALAATLLVALAAPAWADTLKVEGTLQAVDQVSVPPTVTINGIVLNVVAETEIEVFGADAMLADLAAHIGVAAEAEYDSVTLNASEIELSDEVTVSGRVAAVDAVAGTVTIATGQGEQTFTLADDVEITVHGQDVSAAFADLNALVGLKVRVDYEQGTTVAEEIELLAKFRATAGTVTAVDASLGTFSIGRPRHSLDFLVVEETRIRFEGQGGPPTDIALPDLAVGDSVRVQYADLGDVLVALDVRARVGRPQNVVGTITAVDPVNSQFTVQPRRGDPVVLTVDSNTSLRVNGRAGTVADLQLDMKVQVQYVARGGVNKATRVNARS